MTQTENPWTDCPYCGERKSVLPFIAVPALTLNRGLRDETVLYSGHETSDCDACGATVTRDLTHMGQAQLERAS